MSFASVGIPTTLATAPSTTHATAWKYFGGVLAADGTVVFVPYDANRFYPAPCTLHPNP